MNHSNFFPKIKIFLLLLISAFATHVSHAHNEIELLSDSLTALIDKEPEFVRQKEGRIRKMKLKLKNANLMEEYKINQQLYNEYKKFKVDSAIHYIKRNVDIAVALGETEQENDAKLKLSLSYSMGGMYREAEMILKNIVPEELSKDLLPVYYDAYRRYWEYYSISTMRSGKYSSLIDKYIDLYLAHADPNTTSYKICYIMNRIAPQNIQEAKKLLQELLAVEEEGTPDYAIITCELAVLSNRSNQFDLEKIYYMKSAIADIRNVTWENVSLQNLATICYRDNDLRKAFKYTQTAVEEAIASGIQFRATQMNKFYTAISAAYQKQEARAKSVLMFFSILITAFFVGLLVLTIYTYRQIKKIRQIKEKLSESNQKLQELNKTLNDVNAQLQSKNGQLSEANNVKEQFIAQFFDLCSNYITRMEEYQNSLYKLVVNKHYESLAKQLKSTTNINKELETLYSHFDNIFLNLYPSFVSEFNALLREDEHIVLKTGLLLNKELRIYALLRLGINDGTKIANFLRCSTSTVYNYRTRMRNKSIVKDDFEAEVLKIGISRTR